MTDEKKVKNMKEEDFEILLDIAEGFGNLTEEYYPTVKELEDHNVKENINSFLVIVAYFASDPFKRNHVDPVDPEDYKETVSYCKHLLYDYIPA